MNENINLCEILKDCPKGTKLWSPVWGDITFETIDAFDGLVYVLKHKGVHIILDNGKFDADGECIIFPSKDQRDWSKFKAPIKRFNPEEFKPFDKVLLRIDERDIWQPDFFGYKDGNCITCVTYGNVRCIPYNEETKHLAGKRDDCPEYYKWWINSYETV